MGKKNDCESELKQIEKRQQKHAPLGWAPLEVCPKCIMHRWITSDLVTQQGAFLPEVITDKRLSVYVECNDCNFGKFSIKAAVELDMQKGLDIIGSVCLDASFFIGKWHIKHDPFPFPRRGQDVQQHPNHVQIICDKGIDVFYDLSPLMWFVKPGDPFPELERQALPTANWQNTIFALVALIIGCLLVLFSCWK
jgi:hypothetical protein